MEITNNYKIESYGIDNLDISYITNSLTIIKNRTILDNRYNYILTKAFDLCSVLEEVYEGTTDNGGIYTDVVTTEKIANEVLMYVSKFFTTFDKNVRVQLHSVTHLSNFYKYTEEYTYIKGKLRDLLITLKQLKNII